MKSFRLFHTRTVVIATIVSLLFSCATSQAGGPRFSGKVGDDLFKDGSARVELAHATDGDTAAFIISGETIDTRFLAVNTPEVSHPTYGADPWGRPATKFTAEILNNANEIVLELDTESDTYDSYDRLLAWIWVDGELLNYRLVKEGYAWVMFLYGDYKYNNLLIQTESEVRKTKIRIHGEIDPDYDYEKLLVEHTLETLRTEEIGKKVIVKGIVTAKIGNSGYLQDGSSGVYLYSSSKRWRHLQPGNLVEVTGMVSDYNGLLEIGNIESIDLITEGAGIPEALTVRLADIGEQYEGLLVKIEGAEIVEVEPHTGKGYNVIIKQGNTKGVIRIDKYLIPYIPPETFVPGQSGDIIAPVGQYLDVYQLMVPTLGNLQPIDG
ncbi:MAG: hypothetical protein HN368_16485 [Spirochaetales bacterium]|jgi:micrococcal nuclease|nr:hypothetical protein [Spirochaetales bacterium]